MGAFSKRHIGPNETDKKAMLAKIGVNSISELIDKTIPAHIRLGRELNIDAAMTEQEYLNRITELGSKNKVFNLLLD